MPGFIEDTVLFEAIADSLTKNSTTDLVSPAWSNIATRANAMAFANICTILQARGFTLTQINNWDAGTAFQTNQGLYWAFTYGASNHGEDDKWVEKWDMRKTMSNPEFYLSIDGVLTQPDLSQQAQPILSGRLKAGPNCWEQRPCGEQSNLFGGDNYNGYSW